MKDEHHGIWKIFTNPSDGKIILDIKWRTFEGEAQFEKIDSETFKCLKCSVPHLQSWSIIGSSTKHDSGDEDLLKSLDDFMINNTWHAGKGFDDHG